jgi:hypothetical protein
VAEWRPPVGRLSKPRSQRTRTSTASACPAILSHAHKKLTPYIYHEQITSKQSWSFPPPEVRPPPRVYLRIDTSTRVPLQLRIIQESKQSFYFVPPSRLPHRISISSISSISSIYLVLEGRTPSTLFFILRIYPHLIPHRNRICSNIVMQGQRVYTRYRN